MDFPGGANQHPSPLLSNSHIGAGRTAGGGSAEGCPTLTLEQDVLAYDLFLRTFQPFLLPFLFARCHCVNEEAETVLALGAYDLGEPIICSDYDLEDALRRENEACMAREELGLGNKDNEDYELEDPTPPHHPGPAPCMPGPSSLPIPVEPLTCGEKRKQKKCLCERTKRRTATAQSLDSMTPPPPTARILKKASQCMPIQAPFCAQNFRATKPRWTGPTKPLAHPYLAHTNDAEFLKKHLHYVDWRDDKTHVIVDRHSCIIGALISPPGPGEEWDKVVEATTAAMRTARDKMSFPPQAFVHRRATQAGGGFPAEADGFSFGGGRNTVGNIKARSQGNRVAMDELLADLSIVRMATYPIHEPQARTLPFSHAHPALAAFQSFCFPIYADYHCNKQTLRKKNPYLCSAFHRSPFAAVTANLSPVSVSPPHLDGANKTDGMCLVDTLGDFDPDLGRHLVLWDYGLIICFPPGRSTLIPSAVVTHSNTPIQDDEERFSLVQYWPARCSDGSPTVTSLTATALRKFSLWKDVKVMNYTGRSRVELWAEGDVADFSDLTEDEDEDHGEGQGEAKVEERPKKRSRRS
ncbi:hypothetical protein MVEN_00488600 [Mycena venus]|uniref:Uncharacterized protein n=1 Tax=Mycena venus TaxID=2733690 RepID=A0A8H7DBL9_9AGAR|nr:hypothetical protein MVEN_00488600 [Mycena venus]